MNNEQAMTDKTKRAPQRWGTLGRIIAVFGVLFVVGVIAVLCLGVVVVRSLRVADHTGPMRAQLLSRLNVPQLSQVEVAVPPWAVVLGRVTASFAEVDPRLNDALDAFKCGQVGVYELGRNPSRRDVLAMLELADQELVAAGWGRVVTVLEDGQLVAVYQSIGNDDTEFDAYLIALDDRDLVMVSAKGRVEPVARLVTAALNEAGVRDLRF